MYITYNINRTIHKELFNLTEFHSLLGSSGEFPTCCNIFVTYVVS